jgi:hypothetical protein
LFVGSASQQGAANKAKIASLKKNNGDLLNWIRRGAFFSVAQIGFYSSNFTD